MKKIILKYFVFIFIFVLGSLFSSVHVYADGGDGTGPGSGPAKPLSFVSCTLEDGSKINATEGITTEPSFKLQFDKNIADSTVWDRNRKCVTLTTENNLNVPIVVSKIDTFEQRQMIYVHPAVSLDPGKIYYIRVSPDLIARNLESILSGTTDGKGITISFKTKGRAATQNTNASGSTENSASKGTIGSTSNNSAANSTVANQNATSQDSITNGSVDSKNTAKLNNDSQAEASSPAGQMIPEKFVELGTGTLLVCWIVTEMFVNKRKKGTINQRFRDNEL